MRSQESRKVGRVAAVAASWSLRLRLLLHRRGFKERRRLAAEYFLDGAGPAPLLVTSYDASEVYLPRGPL
jgi:hypothetical protein